MQFHKNKISPFFTTLFRKKNTKERCDTSGTIDIHIQYCTQYFEYIYKHWNTF